MKNKTPLSSEDKPEKCASVESRYHFFLESVLNELPIPSSVKSVVKGSKYIFWNKEAERTFGITAEELLGKDGYPFLSKESSEEMMRLNEQVIKTGKRYTGNVDTYVTTTGTRRLLAVNKSIISYKDEDKWLITSVQDITKLQAQKDALEMALRASQLMPWTWDVDRRELRCDFSYDATLGPLLAQYTNQLMDQGKYLSFVAQDYRLRLTRALDEVVSGIRPSLREEFKLTDSFQMEGVPIWLETYGVISERDDRGRPVQLSGTFQQITQHKKMEQELRDARDKAEESNRLKSAFLANMSHEIRTPLNAIVGFSNILATVEDEREKQDYLQIIGTNNELLLQLIGDILDISKIEAGTLDFSYDATDLNGALSELEASSRLRLRTERVKIEFTDRIPECYIHTDKNRMMQVLINFMTNAIKFTREGSIRFGYRLTEDGKKLRFHVTDTGCGISEENLPRIFGRFVKLDNFAQGTGLGLSISEMIVRRMGGEIGAESKPGEGSTFWFTLPFRPVAKSDSGLLPGAGSPAADSVALPENGRFTILIAEDNESNYRLFEAILGNKYRLIHAWNGQEAVDLFSRERPHLVLTDIRMSVLDGYEVLARIRRQCKTIPVIAVTAFALSEDKERMRASGFDDYLAKPVDARLLHEKIIRQIKRCYGKKNEGK